MNEFNLEAHINRIIEEIKGDRKLANHLWLQGFHSMINGSELDPKKIEVYLRIYAPLYKPFTPLIGGQFILAHINPIEKGELFSVYLPFDPDYHFHFSLLGDNERQTFFYSKCPYCILLEPYEFPHIEVKRSIDLSKNEKVRKSISKGTFFYDNRVYITHLPREIIIKGYEVMQTFIEHTKIN